ncbi:unnamed protein product [Acanthoscelides obtectus]|uniref:Uncharacterized protein n=1 Tax=Acanthoscelides obtectus TaxID=200917 RepID=A0A9P0L9R9_ACAOB|nr:unnamed protein product [Acanthoscelides obtectus]CAK1684290.1 hypothetical protein AOBTE_LOCUS34780 [Acanthoscelides obtectus]
MTKLAVERLPTPTAPPTTNSSSNTPTPTPSLCPRENCQPRRECHPLPPSWAGPFPLHCPPTFAISTLTSTRRTSSTTTRAMSTTM